MVDDALRRRLDAVVVLLLVAVSLLGGLVFGRTHAGEVGWTVAILSGVGFLAFLAVVARSLVE